MSARPWWAAGAAAALLGAAPALGAQTVAERVARAGDGTVRLSFATRPEVCGDGAGSIGFGRDDGGRVDHWQRYDSDDGWERGPCVPGPARVSLAVRGGRVTRVRVHVGGRWRAEAGDATDLGTVSAPAAADYLLTVAERGDGAAGGDAVGAAVLADSVVLWPRLLRLARDDARPRSTRDQAVFWVAHAAGDVAAAGAPGAAPASAAAEADREVREQAVFALSQRPRGESVPALLRVARTNADPALRRRAVFWLGQTGGAAALDFFEELLGRR